MVPNIVQKPLIMKEMRYFQSTDQMPAFTKPVEPLPEPFDTNEAIVVLLKGNEAKHLILATSVALQKTNQFFEFVNKVKAKVNAEIVRVDPSLVFSVRSRFESSETLSLVQQKEQTKARELFFSIISQGIDFGSSDVHICVREETGRILYRINGQIRKGKQYASKALREAVGVGFTLDAQEKTRSDSAFMADFAQRCMIPFETKDGKKFNLRYQSEVVIGGFDVVIRYLKNNADSPILTLEQLGYEASQRTVFRYAQKKAFGVTILAGITGSGKTTTLNTIMQTIPSRTSKKLYAYEDPTEYRMFGVSQVSVPAKKSGDDSVETAGSNPFTESMKNFLRLDPDTGMIGEIRDSASASICQQASESGHQIFSTIHATSAIGIVKRLCSPQIGLTRDVVGADNFITLFVYQSLIPKLCPHCKVPAVNVLSAEKLALMDVKFGINPTSMFCSSEKGCPKCLIPGLPEDAYDEDDLRGLSGVTVVAELIVPDDEIREAIYMGDDIRAKKHWRSKRTTGFDDADMTGKTAFEHGLYKVSQGLVDLRSVEAAFEEIEFYEIQQIG